jgi:uncharacterized protein YegL
MNNHLTEVIFILDRSGSMSGLETDTIGGYNSFLDRQRQDPGESHITTVLFDDEYEILHDGVPVQKVEPLTSKTYFTLGSTALLDAVGRTIDQVGHRLSQTPEDQRPGKVIFVITTDGYENASRTYSWSQVRDMIRRQREIYSWEFLFLGADIDAEGIATDLGISQDHAVSYSKSSEGTEAMFETMACVVSELKASGRVLSNWKDDLDPDKKKPAKGKKGKS